MDGARSLHPAMGGQAITRPSDRDLAALAAAQHGLVTRTQLLSRGWPSGAIEHRVAEGRLLVRQRGVYSVGGAPPTRESGWMAAVLATGAGSVLSHRSAAALWGLGNDQDPVPEVTTPALRRRPGIRVHRSRLAPAERTLRGRIPVTTPARTLLDLAAVLGPRDLERAIHEAEIARRLDVPALRRILAAHAGRAGTRGIRTLLAERTMGAEVLRSVFEARFLSFLAGRRLPRPKVNAVLSLGDRRVEVDCLWPDERVIVELDGHGVHGTRAAFERDRERDRGLQVAGWRVVRVTWRQFHQHPDRVERDLRALLAL